MRPWPRQPWRERPLDLPQSRKAALQIVFVTGRYRIVRTPIKSTAQSSTWFKIENAHPASDCHS